MTTAEKSIVTATSGFFSFGVGAWLRLAADSLSTVRLPAGAIQDGDRFHALIAIASAFLWLGVALLVLSAVAWLFFSPAPSTRRFSVTEPVA